MKTKQRYAQRKRAAKTNRLVVLIAEDEEPIAQVLACVIEEAGYMPMLALDGRRALELAWRVFPAMAFIDFQMPQMDGGELIAALRDYAIENHLPLPPVVLMSALRHRMLAAAGADAFLPKPFDVVTVEDLLVRFLPVKVTQIAQR